MMRKFIRSLGLSLARIFGSQVTDFQTGRRLDKALMIPWRGKIHVIGLKENVRPMFQPQERLTYWKQSIVFTVHPSPDFGNVKEPGQDDESQNKKKGAS
jgi:hypothetical protein